MQDLKLSDIGYAQNDGGFTEEEMNKFDGTRVKVVKVEPRKQMTSWDEHGAILPDGQQRETYIMCVETAPLKMNSLGVPVPVVEKFNLKQNKDTGKWMVSLHEKSSSYKLFRKYNVSTFDQLVGMEVILSKKVKQNGKFKLGINIG